MEGFSALSIRPDFNIGRQRMLLQHRHCLMTKRTFKASRPKPAVASITVGNWSGLGDQSLCNRVRLLPPYTVAGECMTPDKININWFGQGATLEAASSTPWSLKPKPDDLFGIFVGITVIAINSSNSFCLFLLYRSLQQPLTWPVLESL